MTDRPVPIHDAENCRHILVVGDFMIDRAWIVSAIPSPTSQAHAEINPMRRIYPGRDDERIGGAGSTLMALRALCQIKLGNEKNEEKQQTKDIHFHLHGIGLWGEKHDNLLKRLAGHSTSDEPVSVRLHRLEVEGEGEIVTTIKARVYSQFAEDRPRLVARYDQDPAPRCLPSFLDEPLAGLALPDGRDICAVIVADFNKGAVQESVLSALMKHVGDNEDCIWLIDSKSEEIHELLPNGLQVDILTMNRQEATKLASRLRGEELPPIPHGRQPSMDLLSRLQDILGILQKKERAVRYLIVKLDSDGACLCDCQGDKIVVSRPLVPLDSEGISAGDFFNASFLLSIVHNPQALEEPKETLEAACSTATKWLRLCEVFWASGLAGEQNTDIVKHELFASDAARKVLENRISNYHTQVFDRNAQSMLGELGRPYRYPTIVETKGGSTPSLDLADAKGFLGDFVCTDPRLRKDIRLFVDHVREYTQSEGPTRPLNCLLAAKPGSGKSFFAKQVANATNCELIEVNCSQVTSKRDLLESIARIQNVAEGSIPLLLIDEVDSYAEYYPLLLSPLWDARVIINGHPRRWRERFVSILVTSEYDDADQYREALRAKGEQREEGKKGKEIDLLTRLNGPSVTLSERLKNSDEDVPVFTSRVYVAAQMLVRYYSFMSVVERGLLDLVYCAPRFDPRAVEHFVLTLPKPVDGVVGLKSVLGKQLRDFAKTLGYKTDDEFRIVISEESLLSRFQSIGYEQHDYIKLDEHLKTQQLRIIDSTGRKSR